MAEYIEREGLLSKFNIDDMMNVNGTLISLRDAREVISNFPAADVAPVRHGSWKYHDDINFWRCSCCGVNAPIAGDFMQLKTNYCSYCGARMDGAE